MLRSVEDLFGLSHLGYAQLPGERSFGSDIFACAPARLPVAVHGHLPTGSEFTRASVAKRHKRVQLRLYSVGSASLRIVVRATGHRTVVIKRQLVPCHSYTIALPSGHGRKVALSAVANGGTQTATLHY